MERNKLLFAIYAMLWHMWQHVFMRPGCGHSATPGDSSNGPTAGLSGILLAKQESPCVVVLVRRGSC